MIDTQDTRNERSGASLLDGDDLFERAGAFAGDAPAVDPDSLPMVVWLKGHENYFSLFELNADQTMEILGVKRSRLNQISGKELRVARKRDGRYIRPYYRKEDVEAYLKWTRSTVTHKRSSEVVGKAAQELAEKADRIGKEFAELKSSLKEELQLKTKKPFQELREFSNAKFDQADLQIKVLLNSMQTLQTSVERLQWKMHENLTETNEKLTRLDSNQEKQTMLVSEILAARQIEKHIFQDISQTLKSIREELTELKATQESSVQYHPRIINHKKHFKKICGIENSPSQQRVSKRAIISRKKLK